MKGEIFLQYIRELIEQQKWDDLNTYVITTNQSYLSNSRYKELKQFYDQVLKIGLNPSKYQKVFVPDDNNDFRSAIQLSLTEVKEHLSIAGHIQAVYFEYFFDGGDACSGNFFLCDHYSEESEGWASSFDEELIVSGPSVDHYLNFDPQLEWDNFSSILAEKYVDAVFLVICAQEWKKLELQNIAFGFAKHDSSLVRIPPPPNKGGASI